MARREGGLTLTVLNAPFADFSAPIPNTRPVTIAGRQGVTWDGEFAETPATFSLIPVEHQTLMVIRQNGGEGYAPGRCPQFFTGDHHRRPRAIA